jgi:hypothetical protein
MALAQPARVERFWEELELSSTLLPISKDANLIGLIADHGALFPSF